MGSTATRVQWLIDRYHGGKVNAAARDTGVPQPTLYGIVTGSVVNPRVDSIQKIAAFYQVGVDWLLTGRRRRRAGSTRLTRPSR